MHIDTDIYLYSKIILPLLGPSQSNSPALAARLSLHPT